MTEFLFISITFLFTVLGVIQLAMVLNANSLVRYAAYNAARAGIVHNGDLETMRDAARMSLLPIFPQHGRADHTRGATENYLAAKAIDNDPLIESFFGEPLTSVKILNTGDIPCETVITFDDPLDTPDAFLTVQVVHHYELVIPLVNRILFWIYMRFKQGEQHRGYTLEQLSKETDKLRRGGIFHRLQYRIPLVATYTMRLQSDYSAEECPPPPLRPGHTWGCTTGCHDQFRPHTCVRCHIMD